MILCANCAGVQSEVPQERRGTGLWESPRMWLWPSSALEPSLIFFFFFLTLWLQNGFAGQGDRGWARG